MTINEEDILLKRYIKELGKAINIIEENIKVLKTNYSSKLKTVTPIEYKVYNSTQMAFPKCCWVEDNFPDKGREIMVNGTNIRSNKIVQLKCIVVDNKRIKFNKNSSVKGGDTILVINSFYSNNDEWKDKMIKPDCFGLYNENKDECILDCANINTDVYKSCLQTTMREKAYDSIRLGEEPWCFGNSFKKDEEKCNKCYDMNKKLYSKCNTKFTKSQKKKKILKKEKSNILDDDWVPKKVESNTIDEVLPICSKCKDGLLEKKLVPYQEKDVEVEICNKCGDITFNEAVLKDIAQNVSVAPDIPELSNCPSCDGGKLEYKTIPFEIKGKLLGNFRAEVCNLCGERLFDENTVQQMQDKAKELGLWGK